MGAGTRFTLYLKDDGAVVLDGFEDVRSPRINQIVIDFQGFVADNTPSFPSSCWELLLDLVASDPSVLVEHRTFSLLWAMVLRHEVKAGSPQADVAELSERLKCLSDSQLRALREVLQQARIHRGRDVSPETALQMAGAIIEQEAQPSGQRKSTQYQYPEHLVSRQFRRLKE